MMRNKKKKLSARCLNSIQFTGKVFYLVPLVAVMALFTFLSFFLSFSLKVFIRRRRSYDAVAHLASLPS
jgi:hypothetical protein